MNRSPYHVNRDGDVLDRLYIGLAIFVVIVVLLAIAQGIGESVGAGIREWLVP